MTLDLLMRNADIITMDDRRPHASSLGVWQGRVVGLDDDLDGLDAAEVLDLDGATVTPGFIGAHCHTTWFGLGLGEADVSGARGLEQLYSLLEADTAAGDGPAPGWLMATGFNQTHHGGEAASYPDPSARRRCSGSLLGETAAVSEDYCSHGHTDNTGNTGYFQADPGALRNRIEAAYAAGKLADFTVLSGSPLTAPDIAGLRVLATAVGGEFTHRESSVRSPVPSGQRACGPSAGTAFISTATNCS
jgi:hypothetical protein